MKATFEHSKAAPVASVESVTIPAAPATGAVSFDLTGTSITKSEYPKFDEYKGPLAELLALGIVEPDQLPPEGKSRITWTKGRHLIRGGMRIDETYLQVRQFRTVTAVCRGLSKLAQDARSMAKSIARDEERQRATADAAAAALRARIVEQQAAAKRAARDLASLPNSKEAFLYGEARHARSLIMHCLKVAGTESDIHGFRICPESMEEIYARIDDLVEAYTKAHVIFDPQLQSKALTKARNRVLHAAPFEYGRMTVWVAPNPSILQGEEA